MKLFKIVTLLLLAAFPALGSANGTYQPGTVSVSANGLNVTGDYNVRYNPAVSTGALSVALSPMSYVEILGVDSTTGKQFACEADTGNESDYGEIETILMSAAAGGNGVTISASRSSATDVTCTSINVGAQSQSLD